MIVSKEDLGDILADETDEVYLPGENTPEVRQATRRLLEPECSVPEPTPEEIGRVAEALCRKHSGGDFDDDGYWPTLARAALSARLET